MFVEDAESGNDKFFDKYPETDDEAIEFLSDSSPDIPGKFLQLREAGMSIEDALIEVTSYDFNREMITYFSRDPNETQ